MIDWILLTDHIRMEKCECWHIFLVFVWVVLGGRDHNTGISDLLTCFELAGLSRDFSKEHSSALGKHMQLINIRKNWERVVTQLWQI